MVRNTGPITPTEAIEEAAKTGVVILSPVLYRAFDAGRIEGTRKEGKIFLDAASFNRWLGALSARRKLFARYRAARNSAQQEATAEAGD